MSVGSDQRFAVVSALGGVFFVLPGLGGIDGAVTTIARHPMRSPAEEEAGSRAKSEAGGVVGTLTALSHDRRMVLLTSPRMVWPPIFAGSRLLSPIPPSPLPPPPPLSPSASAPPVCPTGPSASSSAAVRARRLNASWSAAAEKTQPSARVAPQRPPASGEQHRPPPLHTPRAFPAPPSSAPPLRRPPPPPSRLEDATTVGTPDCWDCHDVAFPPPPPPPMPRCRHTAEKGGRVWRSHLPNHACTVSSNQKRAKKRKPPNSIT